MMSVLLLGFMIGLHHALEADHVAAVSSLVCGKSGVGRIMRHGAIWGVGHTVTLLVVGGGAVLLKTTIDETFAVRIEFLVGLMLVGLGGHVLYRLWRDRMHVHTHRHSDGTIHFHAHSHRGDSDDHAASAHDHAHPRTSWPRTLLVGLMHGLAGSAALVVLTASSLDTPVLGLAFILLFGVGSIIGMAALSMVIAFPISMTARWLTRANFGLQAVIGLATITVGGVVIAETLPLAFVA
jgi:ABC-type nickel/cobalt efflux system permease component RcnA